MKELLPFSEVAKMYGVSESTFRRRLKKLDRKINDYNKLLQREAKKIYTGLKTDARYP